MFFLNLSNEEKFALADFAACQFEKQFNKKLTQEEYEKFVWEFIVNLQSFNRLD